MESDSPCLSTYLCPLVHHDLLYVLLSTSGPALMEEPYFYRSNFIHLSMGICRQSLQLLRHAAFTFINQLIVQDSLV